MPVNLSSFAFAGRLWRLTCAMCLVTATVQVGAAEVAVQPAVSERYEVADAKAAMDEIMARWDAAQAEQQARFQAFDGDLSDFVRSDPVLQDVTWPYGNCTDLVGLIPPPQPNWALRSEFALRENPVSHERAELHFVSYTPGMPTDDPAFFGAQQTVTVRLSASPENVQAIAMMLNEPNLRAATFDEGPFGYPMRKFSNSTIVGPYFLDITGTDEAAVQLYLESILGCAIDNGLIAEGIDPASLSR